MCGILGLAARLGNSPSLTDQQALRPRDRLAHRGPDSAGLWRHRNVLLAHRRLTVIDPSAEADQPMLLLKSGRVASAGFAPGREPGREHGLESPCHGAPPRLAITYNGELYNEPELRRELALLGHVFNTKSDTETVLRAFDQWGTAALPRLRGMFAFAIHDAERNLLTLARDTLGVKPLYYAFAAREIIFASEPGPLLGHPAITAAPNPRMIAAYLMTIRTTLGGETMFDGVRSLPPGCMLQCDCGVGAGPPAARVAAFWRSPGIAVETDPDEAAARVRAAVEDSVVRQMRADVPVCTLLSGGLDSTIISAVARRVKPDLLTYAAGAPIPRDCRDDASGSDLCVAERAARHLRTRHAEAHVTRELFSQQWPEMVRRLGVPLSTPNEVAIHEVARRLRADGCIVTLSGEGADELFAGYDMPLDAAAEFHAANPDAGARDAALHELSASAWTPPDFLPGILREGGEADAGWTIARYEDELAAALEECASAWLDARLRLIRRINLTGLLQRLDTATMLAGVEGRTPFADAEVAALAESLPLWMKYEQELPGATACPVSSPASRAGLQERAAGPLGAAGQAVAPACRTKRVLRDAFAADLPEYVLERPKASFPLPFQGWLEDHAAGLRESRFARAILSDAAIDAVAGQPEKLWRLAWPMINLSHWGAAMGW